MNRLADLLAAGRHPPLDDAAWLMEFVAATRGAQHLKIASRNLSLVQLFCLDVAFVAAADLSSDEFLKGIYNVATSPSRLFTEKAFPQVATRLASHRTIPILVYRPLPLSFRASIVAIRHGSPANFC